MTAVRKLLKLSKRLIGVLVEIHESANICTN